MWLARMGVLLTLMLSGCAGLFQSPAERVDSEARAGMFQPVTTIAGPIKGWLRIAPTATVDAPLTIYIEGDGEAWRGPYLPPPDPTPRNALTLRLAQRDPGSRVAYLGRPCQYLSKQVLTQCPPSFWVRARYGEAAVKIIDAAIEHLKQTSGAARLQLVGFSGGGAIAALLAARRNDVGCFVTLASPLDTVAWTSALDLSPLTESFNPADYAPRLRFVAQSHFSAANDAIVPSATLHDVMQALPYAHFEVIPNCDHQDCWVLAWARLRQRTCLTQ